MNRCIHLIIIALLIIVSYAASIPDQCRGASSHDCIISSFSTSVADQDGDVKRNILIACKKLNGITIGPNSVFSFNDAVGEGSTKNGFAPGRVLYRDRVAIEPGGGLCQVSSTLYNALLMAGCTIMERHRHSQPVTYVPVGLDATIKYGKKDLKIKNPHQFDLKIEIKANQSSLAAVITSAQKPRYRYEIVTEEDEVEMPAGDSADRIRQGISVLVYRKKYCDKDLIDSTLLYRDYYPPVYVR
jgi:vancomycin resistance protein YoaR